LVVKFEYWKRSIVKTKEERIEFAKRGIKDHKRTRVIVARDDKNKILTYRYQKGSGIKSINQAQSQLNKTGTLYENRVRSGNQTIEVNDFVRITKSANVNIIESKTPTKSSAPYQYSALIRWDLGTSNPTSIGYSNLVNAKSKRNTSLKLGNKKEAFDRAIGNAVSQGILSGTSDGYEIQMSTNERGIAIKKGNPKIRVWFKVTFEVVTYVEL